MFSDIRFPNVTSLLSKNPVHSTDLNRIVMMTLRNSPVSENSQVRLDVTSWGVMELLYAIEEFECR